LRWPEADWLGFRGTAQAARVAMTGILRSTALAMRDILGLGFAGLRSRGAGNDTASNSASRRVSCEALFLK
jgi:hypothetical protein